MRGAVESLVIQKPKLQQIVAVDDGLIDSSADSLVGTCVKLLVRWSKIDLLVLRWVSPGSSILRLILDRKIRLQGKTLD